MRINHLVVKPELRCTAKCPTCHYRRALHKKALQQRLLTIEEWKDFFVEVSGLGVSRLDISGGEPMLYPQLPEMISAGKQRGWRVQLNSNGSLFFPEAAARLLDVGLDRAMISLYSAHPAVHDAMRQAPGLWKNAVAAIQLLAGLRRRYPGFEIITQTLLCRENLRELAETLQFHRDLGAEGVVISYLEGNMVGEELMPAYMLEAFRREAVPKLLRFSRTFAWPLRNLVRHSLRNLYSNKDLTDDDWRTGRYHHQPPDCQIPGTMALVLANGDVHPCNVVEYTHEPVVGNLFERHITEIWQGPAWELYRRQRDARCCRCPMLHQRYVPFRMPRPSAALRRLWQGIA